MLKIVIWHVFWGDLSQIEKVSEIKPPLRFELILGCTFMEYIFKTAT